jgi:hypothetical protein
MTFLEELNEQRWDDHRFYHHSRINQTLHLVSALSFLLTYALILFTDHAVFAILFGWLFSMCSRQIGHFFFEPKGYDEMNQATHEYKEAVKVGFNLRRKVVLHSVWAAIPFALLVSKSFFGVFQPWADLAGYMDHLARVWLVLAGAALVGRTVQLFFIRGVQTGLAWFTKILTDPFNDVRQYWRAPFALMRGELIQPPHERAA